MQITFSTTVAVVQQTQFGGNDTDKLLTFNRMLQMGRELCRWLLMPGNKWGNYEHIPHGSSIICIHDMAQHVLESLIFLMQIQILSCTDSFFFSYHVWSDPWMKICSSLSHITGTKTTCQICSWMPFSKEESSTLYLFSLKYTTFQ